MKKIERSKNISINATHRKAGGAENICKCGFLHLLYDFYINIDVLIHEPDSYFDHNARVPTMQKMRNMNYLVFIMNTQLLRTYLNSNTLVQF